MSGDEQMALTELWQRRWPACPPVAHTLKGAYRPVWVRFHSLPESKRYPDNEGEYATLLQRHNAILDELFTGADVYVINPVRTTTAEVPPCPPGSGYWRRVPAVEDPDPDFRTYGHLFFVRRSWASGCIDRLLRDVADDEVAGVLITDLGMRRLYHPYDGGADVFLTSSEERDLIRARHADWLSAHPSGL